jgi:alkaline phosphatase D
MIERKLEMKRRDFVSLLAGATSGLITRPAYSSIVVQQALPDAAQWLRSGPLLGHSEMTSTSLWLQTRKACRAQLRFWKREQPATARLSDIIETHSSKDLIARFNLSQLEFGTKYDYELYLDGLRVALPENAALQTQAMWRYRTSPPPFRIAIGSCAYVNDTAYDRPGTPYGGNYEIFSTIAKEQPELMIWLGDNNYYREADWLDEGAMRYRMAHGRELPELRKLFAATHHYAIWDDHDFGPNDSDRTFRERDVSLDIFRNYWSNAAYGTDEARGVFSRFEWADAEFFLLDGRYHRSPNAWPDPMQRVMFGEVQMRWLMESLRSSSATFKIIAGGNQMLNPLTFYEAFGKCPAEQKQLIDFIREARVPGVLFISGDRHHTELIRRNEPGLYPLYDFTSSPLTSTPPSANAREANNPARVPGTWVTGVRNFGLIEASGSGDDRKLTLRTVDYTGQEKWRHDIRASELRFA